MFHPVSESHDLSGYVYRCDDFTPASFVSRAASIARERLAEIDLLPKLERKVLNTKELAPIFRGKEEDLIRIFAILTSILDGDGHITAGGCTGTRGYSDRIFFCWLGATTPFTKKQWQIMAALGPRILFYATDAAEPSIEDLVRCQREEKLNTESAMQLQVNDFLAKFFDRNPPETVPEARVSCSELICRQIALWARLIARLRAGLTLRDKEDRWNQGPRYNPPEKEHEYRLVKTLNRLARASALVMGRNDVGDQDLALIRHIALSSGPETRRRVAKGLIDLTASVGAREPIQIGEIAEAIGASPPTLRHYAEELAVLRIARYNPVKQGDPRGGTLTLAEDLVEILPGSDTHLRIAFKHGEGPPAQNASNPTVEADGVGDDPTDPADGPGGGGTKSRGGIDA